MYQTEIEQPTQMGMMKQTIPQVPRKIAQETKCEKICDGEKMEKEQLMENIKCLMKQVQEMLQCQEQQCCMTEQEEMLRKIKDLQCEVRGLILNEKQQCMMPQYSCEYPTRKYEMMTECQPINCEKLGMPMINEKRRQIIEKMILQCKIFEDMLIEKQCQVVFQMPKMEQFCLDLELELFEQIKKKCCEFEQICCNQEIEGMKMFIMIKQYIQQIGEILCPMRGVKIVMKTKEQCEKICMKVMKLRCLLEEICLKMCQESFEKRCYGIEKNQICDMMQYALPVMGMEAENKMCGKQQEKSRIEFLRRELEDIKMAKQQLEMKLNETNKKVEQFKYQIELMERMPKKQCEQFTAEFVQCTKPEQEMIQVCMKPAQQQTNCYIIASEPNCEMMVNSKIAEPRQITTRFY